MYLFRAGPWPGPNRALGRLTLAAWRVAAAAKLPAELAAACLRSVPNHQQPAVKLIQSLRAYVQWHSSLAWLRRPPPAYPFPPVDVDAGLARLGAQVEAHQFASEYDFQVQLGRLLASARDPHLVFEGDVFKPFLFRNDLLSDIVSVSIDGVELPKLHHKSKSRRRRRYQRLTGPASQVAGVRTPRSRGRPSSGSTASTQRFSWSNWAMSVRACQTRTACGTPISRRTPPQTARYPSRCHRSS